MTQETTTIKALLIPADPRAEWKLVDVVSGWRELAKAIGAQYIEEVYSDSAHEAGLAVIVDELGRITGREVNLAASILFGRPTGFLVGDVLIAADGDEHYLSITQEQANLLTGWRSEFLN